MRALAEWAKSGTTQDGSFFLASVSASSKSPRTSTLLKRKRYVVRSAWASKPMKVAKTFSRFRLSDE